MIGTFPGAGAGPSDFRWYYLAAHSILEGRSPYVASGYLYPPLTAFLFTPLATLDDVLARRVWFVLSQGFLLSAALILWRRLGADWRSACIVAFVWATGSAADETLALGQIGPPLTLLVVLASFPGRLRENAVSLGTAVKMIPGVLLLTLALQRYWKLLFRSVALTAFLLLAPWLYVNWFLAGPASPASAAFLAGTPTILSWSAPSVVLRVLEPPGADAKPPVSWVDSNLADVHLDARARNISLAVSGLVMIAGVAALAYSTRGRLTPQFLPYASAALISLTLLASPVCWTHYEVLQYPGAAILLNRAVRTRRWITAAGVLTCWAFLYSVPVTVLRASYVSHGGSWPPSPAFLYFWTSISAVACAGLFLLALREAR